MINLAVGLLESDASDGTAEKLVLDHIRDDIRYVVVDESQCSSRACATTGFRRVAGAASA